jgi:hypothetical protein
MNTKQRTLTILILVTSLVMSGCGQGQLFGPTITPTATYTPIPPTSTVTPVPPTRAPSVVIRLGPGRYGQPLWLEVVEGDYMVTGATLWAGSAIDVAEDWLTFPPGLAIDVEGGDIVLKGTTYSQGTRLIVDAQGNLIPR